MAKEEKAASKWVRLREHDPVKGRRFRSYSKDGLKFIAGGKWVEVSAEMAEYLSGVYNPAPKGAERGAVAFDISDKPKA